MASELKRVQQLRSEDREVAPSELSLRRPTEPSRATLTRLWFQAIDPERAEAAEAPRRRDPRVAAPFFLVALVLVAVGRSLLLRVMLPLALALAAVAILARARAPRPAPPPPKPRERGLALDADRLDFKAETGTQTLVYTDAPFGVTLVANAKRTALVGVLTSSAGTFSVGASLASDDGASVAPLLAAASTAADDAGLEAVGPDGERLVVSAEAFASLVDALALRNPTCLGRFVLSDARGAPVTLDDEVLAVGDHRVDLTSPVEWRSLVFQETFGSSVAVYQGTWVRQGAAEFVLVSLLPSLGAGALHEADLAGLDRGVLRDLRLMQAAPEQPPPAEQRVAIERLFMVPLRAALDRAPRASAPQTRAQA